MKQVNIDLITNPVLSNSYTISLSAPRGSYWYCRFCAKDQNKLKRGLGGIEELVYGEQCREMMSFRHDMAVVTIAVTTSYQLWLSE